MSRRQDVKIFHLLRRLQDVLEDKKLLRFITTKADNRFELSLDFGYVLHHCNAKGPLYIRMTLLNACA